MKIELQARDIQIMKFVFACRAVTYNQIVRRHFTKVHETIAWRRIRMLSKCGYFKVSVIELHGKAVRVVQPLPAIWPVICEKWSFEVNAPHFKTESLEHDIRMAEVVMRLEKLRCFRSFFTENLLQSSLALSEDPRFRDAIKLQSDGALSIVDSKGTLRVYAVELELSKKSPDRYRQKFIDYYLAQGIDGVLYVSPEQEVISLITRIDDEVRNSQESIMHFAFEKSVLSANPKLIFSNAQEGELEFS